MKDINAQLLFFCFFFNCFDCKITKNGPSIAYDSHEIPSNNDGCLSNNQTYIYCIRNEKYTTKRNTIEMNETDRAEAMTTTTVKKTEQKT